MSITKNCPTCSASFKPIRAQQYCSPACANKAEQKRRHRARHPAPYPVRQCPQCNLSFTPTRKDKRFCSSRCCIIFNQRKRAQPANVESAKAHNEPLRPNHTAANVESQPRHNDAVGPNDTARLFADGFYLADLHQEIERVRKTPGIVASLEAQLRQAMMDDAVWPLGKVGRIALTLALLKDISLLKMPVKWRHPHEARRRPGDYAKVTGARIHLHRRPGFRF